jgi:hypothetical protein
MFIGSQATTPKASFFNDLLGQRHVFTILCICYHKQKRYYPPDAIKTALRRMQSIVSGESKARPCDRPR